MSEATPKKQTKQNKKQNKQQYNSTAVTELEPGTEPAKTSEEQQLEFTIDNSAVEAESEPEPDQELVPSWKLNVMSAWSTDDVAAWLHSLQHSDTLTAAEHAAVSGDFAEDEIDGEELMTAAGKFLRRMLRGTAAEGAAERLLAAREAAIARLPASAVLLLLLLLLQRRR